MTATSSALELLRARHAFPGPFTFKVIGVGDEAFATRITQVIAAATDGRPTRPSTRRSTRGAHQALTFRVEVASAEQVLATLDALRREPGTHLVL